MQVGVTVEPGYRRCRDYVGLIVGQSPLCQHGFSMRDPERPIFHPKQDDSSVHPTVFLHLGQYDRAGQSKIPRPPGILPDPPHHVLADGDTDFGQQFAGPDIRAQRALKKINRWNRTRTGRPDDAQFRPQRAHGRRQFRGRVGMSQTPPYCSGIPNGRMTDQARGRSQNGNGLSNTRVPLKPVLPGECANMQVLTLLADITQLVQAVNVHNNAGGCQPHIKKRHQALSAGENLGLVTILHQDFYHLFG